MELLTIVISFVFGAIIGSFLNVVSLRLNTGMGLGGRSKCMSCGSTLTWKELVPLFSFAVQKGSCKKCKSKISWQYPLVEFVAGVIFVLVFVMFPPTDAFAAIQTVLYLAVSCILLVIAAYDIKHKIIPDRFVYVFIALAFGSVFLNGAPSWGALLAGPILALPFLLLWAVSKGAWMGFGDFKLVLGIGWLLGLDPGANALILSFWIAAAISVAWLLLTYRRFKPRTEIPFGPYLILGMYLVLFFRIQVIDFSVLKSLIFGV